jgi:hypothetical protein
LKRQRRIEITAFRRRVTVTQNSATSFGSGSRPLRHDDEPGTPDIRAIKIGEIDAASTKLRMMETNSSPELMDIVRAVVNCEGGDTIQEEQQDVRPSNFYSKLHSLRASLGRMTNSRQVKADELTKDRSGAEENK